MVIIENFDLTCYNAYRIKAFCKKAYFPTCEDDFKIIFSRYNADEIVILGGGYNIILSQPYYEKSFIIVGNSFADINVENNDVIYCEAGVSTEMFSVFALNKSLTGAEIFYDIPSSIGGAVVMNAGASGEEIKDLLVKVRYLDLDDMLVKEIINNDIGFEYRNSFFQKHTNKVVLKAWFKLKLGNRMEIERKMNEVKSLRWAKQPRDLPNCGSVFKRPQGFYVGALIDELQLKGYTVGDAQISIKHGGFIVNLGNASGSDILKIIKEVKRQVMHRFGIDLEVEQRII
ncbi:MAG: UDP-N-acetylmuramate dehydrogenase [Nitritalea sp.]